VADRNVSVTGARADRNVGVTRRGCGKKREAFGKAEGRMKKGRGKS
jgi:hypothetical protein